MDTYICNKDFRVQRTCDTQSFQELYRQAIGIEILKVRVVATTTAVRSRFSKVAKIEEKYCRRYRLGEKYLIKVAKVVHKR